MSPADNSAFEQGCKSKFGLTSNGLAYALADYEDRLQKVENRIDELSQLCGVGAVRQEAVHRVLIGMDIITSNDVDNITKEIFDRNQIQLR